MRASRYNGVRYIGVFTPENYSNLPGFVISGLHCITFTIHLTCERVRIRLGLSVAFYSHFLGPEAAILVALTYFL